MVFPCMVTVSDSGVDTPLCKASTAALLGLGLTETQGLGILLSLGITVGSVQGGYVAAFLNPFWRRTVLGSGPGPSEANWEDSR